MIENQKIEFDTYFEGINKTEEEFEKELASSADLRLKRAIIVDEIMYTQFLTLKRQDIMKKH